MNFSIIQKSQLEGALRLDAEYYQPEYLESQKILSRWPVKKLVDICKVSDGNHMSVSESFSGEGIRYLRGKDLNDFFVSDDDPIYIPERVYSKLRRSHIFEDDVLVSIVGTVGLVSIVADDIDKLTGNCKIAILRSNKQINPWFLSVFLVSRYGQDQIQRKVAGAVQTGIILQDLATITIPQFKIELQTEIGKIIQASYQKQKESKHLYSQAENLLLEELGLVGGMFDDELSYVVSSSDARSANRIDADYFQPKYKKLISKIKTKNPRLLGDLVSLKKGVEVGSEAYQEEGKPFIRVSNLSKYVIEKQSQKYINEELYRKLKAKFEPKVGEILLTKDATPGVAYVLKEAIEGVVASGILRLKLKTNVELEYLALVLNSIVGQMQMERDTGGSVIFHWRPDQIKNCSIPILPKLTQQKIADLVRQSHEARKKSKQFLEKAKREVEEMIEIRV